MSRTLTKQQIKLRGQHALHSRSRLPRCDALWSAALSLARAPLMSAATARAQDGCVFRTLWPLAHGRPRFSVHVRGLRYRVAHLTTGSRLTTCWSDGHAREPVRAGVRFLFLVAHTPAPSELPNPSAKYCFSFLASRITGGAVFLSSWRQPPAHNSPFRACSRRQGLSIDNVLSPTWTFQVHEHEVGAGAWSRRAATSS